jgi:trehalose synthase
MGDTEFLRLTLRLALELGIDQASLVHALQNHDELTHELVHFATKHRDDVYVFGGEEITGGALAERVRADLVEHLTGPERPYNRTFTTNGIACTTATVITATLGIRDLAEIGPAETAQVTKIHLLLAMFNALQPGVFALSGWDLTGMLTLDTATVADLIADGDTRWINRGAHDLMGSGGDATQSEGGMPAGRALYGPLPAQLEDTSSFASRLSRIIDVRRRHGIATATQVDVPDVSHRAMLVMVNRLDGDPGPLQVTVLNFSGEPVNGTVRSEHLPPGSAITDLFTDAPLGAVDDLHSFSVSLDAYGGTALLVAAPEPEPEEAPSTQASASPASSAARR